MFQFGYYFQCSPKAAPESCFMEMETELNMASGWWPQWEVLESPGLCLWKVVDCKSQSQPTTPCCPAHHAVFPVHTLHHCPLLPPQIPQLSTYQPMSQNRPPSLINNLCQVFSYSCKKLTNRRKERENRKSRKHRNRKGRSRECEVETLERPEAGVDAQDAKG